MENKDIASAKRTIDKEVEALRMMEGELDDTRPSSSIPAKPATAIWAC